MVLVVLVVLGVLGVLVILAVLVVLVGLVVMASLVVLAVLVVTQPVHSHSRDKAARKKCNSQKAGDDSDASSRAKSPATVPCPRHQFGKKDPTLRHRTEGTTHLMHVATGMARGKAYCTLRRLAHGHQHLHLPQWVSGVATGVVSKKGVVSETRGGSSGFSRSSQALNSISV